MILKRKVDNYLKKWKENPTHFPLIISVARQIGKTTSIRKFGRENYNKKLYLKNSASALFYSSWVCFSEMISASNTSVFVSTFISGSSYS